MHDKRNDNLMAKPNHRGRPTTERETFWMRSVRSKFMPRPLTRTRGLRAKSCGKQPKPALIGRLLPENCNGPVINIPLTPASGILERDAANAMPDAVPCRDRVIVGAPYSPSGAFTGNPPKVSRNAQIANRNNKDAAGVRSGGSRLD